MTKAMADLAARFPGALRQLDRFPLELIEGRLARLAAASRGTAPTPPWAAWEVAYHGRLRATLRVKRALGLAGPEDEPMRLAVRAWGLAGQTSSEPGEPGEPAEPFTRAHLEAIQRPSGGRLNSQVLADVAREVGATVDEVRRALFGPVSAGDDGGGG